MTQKANFFKLGLFMITAFTIGTVLLIVFGAGDLFKNELLAETCFNESVQGLSVGSEVKYKGIKIGTVKSIQSASQVYRTKSDYVLVMIALEENIFLGQTGETVQERVEKAVEDGLFTRLSFKGLTGVAYLETDYAPIQSADLLEIPWTPNTIYIPSQKSNMKQLGDALNQILDNLNAINIQNITTNIELLLSTLNAKASDFDAKAISAMTATLIQTLQNTTEKLHTTLESEQVQALLTDAGVSFSELRAAIEASKDPFQSAIQDLQTSAQTLENLLWLNSGKIERMVDHLEASSENLRQMTLDLKQYPGRLLFEAPPQQTLPDKETP